MGEIIRPKKKNFRFLLENFFLLCLANSIAANTGLRIVTKAISYPYLMVARSNSAISSLITSPIDLRKFSEIFEKIEDEKERENSNIILLRHSISYSLAAPLPVPTTGSAMRCLSRPFRGGILGTIPSPINSRFTSDKNSRAPSICHLISALYLILMEIV